MARRDAWKETELLRGRLYRQELDRWSGWLTQQDRLRAMLPRAFDVLEDALDAGGPDAVPVALALVKLLGVAGPVDKPQEALLGFVNEPELRARLARHGGENDVPALESGAK